MADHRTTESRRRDAAWLRVRCAAVACAALCFSAIAGCGYHVVGTASQLPADIRSIGVGTITNASHERGIEKELAFAFEREIHQRRHYRMAERREDADAVITGHIIDVSRRPVAFDENDQAVQYEMTIWVDLRLERTGGGERLWEARNLRLTDEYASNPRVLITSSSEFQQGGLGARDVPGSPDDRAARAQQITTIQLAESERRQALRRLLTAAARQTYNRMVERF